MDIEHPAIAQAQRHGFVPEDRRFREESERYDDLFERMLEDALEDDNDEEEL